ncbi:MAG: hypothetical protein HY788_16240 [Deltaproteobacteria bacterium]|nr:hypothetical protein [Deltaproteobacteria bacterium]
MRRMSYLLLTCLLVLNMGSLAYSGTEVMQDESWSYSPGALSNQAISDGSIVREVYTAVAPSDPEAFLNDFATRVFKSGETVNLYARYAFESEKTYTGYWIVVNGGGQIVFFNSFNSTNTGGVNARSTNVSLGAGTYLLHLVIIGEGVTVMSPNPFVFVVE